MDSTCTCTAPVNIAVVKYWGKRNEELVLPVNSSVSVTLDQEQLRAKTTVRASKDFKCNRFWLNGREESMNTSRLQNLLQEVKFRAQSQENTNTEILNWNIHICSENNFPTAAGLASSAAGYACLAYTLAKLYNVKGDITNIARLGSGSACRSIHGGFVVWDKGEKEDGSDSLARQIATEVHWSQLHVLILVVSDQKKHIGSSAGMQTTIRSSELMAERIRLVTSRVKHITDAILNKDFNTFAEITMKESNQLHAVCLDTYPPITYQTDVSRQIMTMVHAYNKYCGQNKVAYTFDAGPNACLYVLEENITEVASLISHFFPPGDIEEDFFTGLPVNTVSLEEECVSAVPLQIQRGEIRYIIHTKPGSGPQMSSSTESLLLDNGLPKKLCGIKRKSDCIL